jgi:hypothetical protein
MIQFLTKGMIGKSVEAFIFQNHVATRPQLCTSSFGPEAVILTNN